MPWEHCGLFVLDDEPCPGCGITKAAWTIEIEKTRVFQLSAKRPPAVQAAPTGWPVLSIRRAASHRDPESLAV